MLGKFLSFVVPIFLNWAVVAVITAVAWPLGWQTYVRAQGGPGFHPGLFGAERVYFVRRAPGAARVTRLKARHPSAWLASLPLILAMALIAPAFAQTSATAAPATWLYDLWTILQPIVGLAVTLIGVPLVGYIAARVAALLGKNDEAARLKIEAQVRAALHEAAANALKYAIAKRTGPIGDMLAGAVPHDVLADAVDYVRSKSPDAAAGVDDPNLIEIILSKVPDLQAVIRAAAPKAVAKSGK